MAMRDSLGRTARCLACAGVLGCVAISAAGCVTTGLGESKTAIPDPAAMADADWRRDADALGARYRANPADADVAIAYARALNALGQRPQAVSVLQQTSMRNPTNKTLLGAYGRALADVGNYQQALDVLSRAHSPDQPDWHVLSAQGAVLDQMGRHEDAQRYYASALKMAPDEPTVLSNLGLSYALAKNLPKAEATLRRAAERPGADPRVRQNLALVVGLQGRFAEAEGIARADLPPDQAAANVAYLKQMMSDHNDLARSAPAAKTTIGAGSVKRPAGERSAAAISGARPSP